MTTARLIINGKEIEVQLTEEQAQELTAPKKEETGFERTNKNSCYFYANALGKKDFSEDYNSGYDDDRYATANYYTDESLAEWCIRNDTLSRKMRRWAAEHNPDTIDWMNGESKWYIYYNCEYKDIGIGENKENCSAERVYFQDYSTTIAAIEEFGDEIKWLAENRPKWF